MFWNKPPTYFVYEQANKSFSSPHLLAKFFDLEYAKEYIRQLSSIPRPQSRAFSITYYITDSKDNRLSKATH